MKKILLYLILFTSFNYLNSQCDSNNLSTFNPNPADNSGNITILTAINTGDYVVISNLITSNSYTLSLQQDLSAPAGEPYLTVRSVTDNSVIAFGNTPLSFNAPEEEVEMHFFVDSSCSAIFDLVLIDIQNNTTLDNNSFTLNNSIKLWPNPTSENINIKSNDILDRVEIYDIQGKLLNKFENLTTNETSIPVEMYNAKLLFVKVYNFSKSTSQTFKINKI